MCRELVNACNASGNREIQVNLKRPKTGTHRIAGLWVEEAGDLDYQKDFL